MLYNLVLNAGKINYDVTLTRLRHQGSATSSRRYRTRLPGAERGTCG